MSASKQWNEDWAKWRGTMWQGPDAHWCADWDELPVSALTPEYDCCVCYRKTLLGRICNYFYMRYWHFRANRVTTALKRKFDGGKP